MHQPAFVHPTPYGAAAAGAEKTVSYLPDHRHDRGLQRRLGLHHQQPANIAIGAPDTLLDGGGIDYTEIGAIRWVFAIAPEHPLAFVPEPIAESQLRLYPNIMVEDTAHTINKKVGWLLHGQEAILVPDFNTKCQCQILGDGIGFLPEYMAREAVEDGLLVTRRINNPRQDSRMLLATQHAATGQVTRWIKQQFGPQGVLTGIYSDLLWRA